MVRYNVKADARLVQRRNVEVCLCFRDKRIGIGHGRIVQLRLGKSLAIDAKVFDGAGEITVAPAGNSDVVVLITRQCIQQSYNVILLSGKVTIIIHSIIIRAIDVKFYTVCCRNCYHNVIGCTNTERRRTVNGSRINAFSRAIFETNERYFATHPRLGSGNIKMIICIRTGTAVFILTERKDMSMVVTNLWRIGIAERHARIFVDLRKQIPRVDL